MQWWGKRSLRVRGNGRQLARSVLRLKTQTRATRQTVFSLRQSRRARSRRHLPRSYEEIQKQWDFLAPHNPIVWHNLVGTGGKIDSGANVLVPSARMLLSYRILVSCVHWHASLARYASVFSRWQTPDDKSWNARPTWCYRRPSFRDTREAPSVNFTHARTVFVVVLALVLAIWASLTKFEEDYRIVFIVVF